MTPKTWLKLGAGLGIVLVAVWLYYKGAADASIKCHKDLADSQVKVLTDAKNTSNTIKAIPSDELSNRLSRWVLP